METSKNFSEISSIKNLEYQKYVDSNQFKEEFRQHKKWLRDHLGLTSATFPEIFGYSSNSAEIATNTLGLRGPIEFFDCLRFRRGNRKEVLQKTNIEAFHLAQISSKHTPAGEIKKNLVRLESMPLQTEDRIRKSAEQAQEAGARVLVIHANNIFDLIKSNNTKDFNSCLRQLNNLAQHIGIKIALENYHRSIIEDLSKKYGLTLEKCKFMFNPYVLCEKIKEYPNLGLWLDVSHLANSLGEDEIEEFPNKLQEQIKKNGDDLNNILLGIHISDFEDTNHDGFLPGTHKIGMRRTGCFLIKLEKIGYNGRITLEVIPYDIEISDGLIGKITLAGKIVKRFLEPIFSKSSEYADKKDKPLKKEMAYIARGVGKIFQCVREELLNEKPVS